MRKLRSSIREIGGGEWRVVCVQGANFLSEVDALKAIRLCEAAYKQGRHDHAYEIEQLLSE